MVLVGDVGGLQGLLLLHQLLCVSEGFVADPRRVLHLALNEAEVSPRLGNVPLSGSNGRLSSTLCVLSISKGLCNLKI